MRDAYHDDLDAVSATLVSMAAMVDNAIVRASKSLLESDRALAEEVIAADAAIDTVQHELDNRTVDLMARQAPVASDLRVLVTSLRMSADLERMGDLAAHIAKAARMRFPACAVPVELQMTILEMGRVASDLVNKTALVIRDRDIEGALQVERDDDQMDRLHRQLFITLLDPSWPHGIETAIDVTLIGRYYERFADHAVSVARRLYYSVTGEYAAPQN
ncbi:MAG: phosphate transport system regulatory protein PhoU [Actinobacteria bacterium]|nr:MAG: phosphate transport system regulatory protein PhoU [Actinomycetota bacterium]